MDDIHKVDVAGTKGYMAPELEMDSPIRGNHNDIYSVAISFFRLLIGDKDTPQAEIENLLESKIENDKIREILSRGLEQDHTKRADA